MVTTLFTTSTPPVPRPPLPHVASVECSCGAIHNSADGRVPVGWTVSRGEAFCTDCTMRGIPTRLITHPAPPVRKTDDSARVRLRGEVIDLLAEGQKLMPLGSKKRSGWVERVNLLLASVAREAA